MPGVIYDVMLSAAGSCLFAFAPGLALSGIKSRENTLEKLKLLFESILGTELRDKSRNVIRELHLQNDIVTNYKLMMASVRVISPIVTELLTEGTARGELHADYPAESSQMIVAMMTFLPDNSFFPQSDDSRRKKLMLYAQILDTCLKTKPGSFNFLFDKR